jgi:ketopantoate reductase
MRFIIVGAGAVGALVGAQLARAGHDVSFWVRPSRRDEHARLTVESVAGGRSPSDKSYELTARFLSVGDTPPPHDWVFVCVRGEQLDEALQQVAAHIGASSNVIISTISFAAVTERARSQGLQGHVLAHHVAFGVHRDAADRARFVWFPFAAPSIVSADRDRSRLPYARELAQLLTQAGLSSRAMLSAHNYMLFMVALSAPFLAAWDACHFDLERLANDTELRQLTARAMVEAPRAVNIGGPFRLLCLLPALFWSAVLRLLPHVIGRNGREVWRHHGPKVRVQTRYSLDLLLRAAKPQPALRALADRFAQRHPRASSTPGERFVEMKR